MGCACSSSSIFELVTNDYNNMIINEINKIRRDPSSYAKVIKKSISSIDIINHSKNNNKSFYSISTLKNDNNSERIYKLNEYTTPTLDEASYKLNSIIGIKELKEFIDNVQNNYKVQNIRERLGLTTSKISMNMIFAGNAGTGKTNAARTTFEYLNALGLLSRGVFK